MRIAHTKEHLEAVARAEQRAATPKRKRVEQPWRIALRGMGDAEYCVWTFRSTEKEARALAIRWLRDPECRSVEVLQTKEALPTIAPEQTWEDTRARCS